MFKNKKGKRYKLKNLYICFICKIVDEEYYTPLHYKLIPKIQCVQILYRSFFHHIDPLTKRSFNCTASNIGDTYVIPACNICEFFDIPNEILLRGDYLTLSDLLKYSKELKDFVQKAKDKEN